jgi:Thioredoxin
MAFSPSATEYSSTMNATEKYVTDGMKDSHSYAEYRDLIDQLLVNNKVTGTEQSIDHLEFTKLNTVRMNRWDKHGKLNLEIISALDKVQTSQTWLVISEGWCGDSAQIIPFFNKISEQQPLINLRIIIRDNHASIMEANLTNGTRSIPKLVVLNDDNREIWTWGPRPQEAVQLMSEWKQTMAVTEAKEKLHLWYARNGGAALMHELSELILSAEV